MSVSEIHEKIYNSIVSFWEIFLGSVSQSDPFVSLLFNGFVYGTLIFLALMIVLVPWKLLTSVFGRF